jgi:hypothetical protein
MQLRDGLGRALAGQYTRANGSKLCVASDGQCYGQDDETEGGPMHSPTVTPSARSLLRMSVHRAVVSSRRAARA